MEWFAKLCSPSNNRSMAAVEKGHGGMDGEGNVHMTASTNNVMNMFCCDPKVQTESHKVMEETEKKSRAGVGIILALHSDQSLYVHTVCPGSSAEHYLFPGDILMQIGTEDVFRARASTVAELLLGPPDTDIEMWVRRPNPNSNPPFTTHHVKMIRRRTDPALARSSIRAAFKEAPNPMTAMSPSKAGIINETTNDDSPLIKPPF